MATPCSIGQDCNTATSVCVVGKPGWRKLPPMATPRGYTCAAYDNHAAYVFGGILEAKQVAFTPPIASAEKFDFLSQKWSSVMQMPTGALAAACVSLNNKIYVIGGRVAVSTEQSGNSDIVQVYNLTTQGWEAGSRMNRQRAWAGAATLGGKIYVVGGVRGVRPQKHSLPSGYQDSAESYDPTSGNWVLLQEKLAAGRYALGVSALKDQLYAVGGSNFPGRTRNEASTDYALIESLDLVKKQWIKVGHLQSLKAGWI